jgi:hypothetical protein
MQLRDLSASDDPVGNPVGAFYFASSTNPSRRHDFALGLIAMALLVGGLAVLAIRWNTPLLGMHSFRQTQTAITSYWIIRGAPWLAYPTPVLGAPWSIPFEFPVYQLLVAGLVKLTGLPLAPAGRMLSYLFVVLTILPAGMLARAYGVGKKEVLVFAILMLASPIYLFWGTAFLMETLVVFFCFVFLAGVEHVARTTSQTVVLGVATCGTIGALGKITTFFPFFFLAGSILLYHLVIRFQRRQPFGYFIVGAAEIMAPPPIIFWFWNRFADAEKLQNPIGKLMISTNARMLAWNFGTWGQLFSREFLVTLLRACTDTLGLYSIIILALIGFVGAYNRVFDRRICIAVAAMLFGFLLPFIVFTNLHIVHNYYDTANAVFLIGAVAAIIGRLFSAEYYRTAWVSLLLVIASQLLWFRVHFIANILHPQGEWQMAIAQTVRSHTEPGSVVIIYGQNWSSVIPYYAERRALMEPDFVPRGDVIARLRHALSPVGGYPVEAIVRCPSPIDRDPEFVRDFSSFDAALAKQHIGPCDVYFAGRKAARNTVAGARNPSAIR